MPRWTHADRAVAVFAVGIVGLMLAYLLCRQPREAVDELAEEIAIDEQRAKNHIASFPDFVPASKGKQHDDIGTANGWIWRE